MAKKKYQVNILSQSSVEALKNDLIKYKDDLETKCRLIVERLAEKGINVAREKISESPLGKYVTLSVDISEDVSGCKAMIIAVGQNKESEGYEPFNTLLAIEFGAGIYYNPVPNPNADKFGLGVGTFPGQIHAFENYWYYWDDSEKKWKPTHGVKATMPMYNASLEIQNDIYNTVKEVFK